MKKPVALEWLLEVTDYAGKTGRRTRHDAAKLERAKRLLEKIGNPQKDFDTVHVVGTKGKGSTAAMIAAILTDAGVRTGLYMSPHIERITERISVDGEEIPPEILNSVITEMREKAPELESGEYTFFEAMTGAALAYFRMCGVQVAVLEAGMGGAFTATNACDSVAVVITNIGLEHVDALGPGFEDVARHKTGAIRPGVPVFTTAWVDSGLPQVQRKCEEAGAPLTVVEPKPDEGVPASAPLKGRHQRVNAALAIESARFFVERYSATLDISLISEALARVKLPARIEQLGDKPLFIIDGAHTPDSMADLAHALRHDFRTGGVVLVVSMKEDKNIPAALKEIVPLVALVVATRYDYPGFAAAEAIAGVARNLRAGLDVRVREPVADALADAVEAAGPDGTVVVAGSFYLAGDARKWYRKNFNAGAGEWYGMP